MKVAIDMYPDGRVNVRSLDGTRGEGVQRLQELLDQLRIGGLAFDQTSEIEQHSHDQQDAEAIRANS